MSDNAAARPSTLIQALGERLSLPLALQDGACALFGADNQERAVLEFSPVENIAIVHCRLRPAGDTAALDTVELLSLNGDQARLGGCWLALDQGGALRLMSSRELTTTSSASFCDWVLGFMQVSQEVDTRLPR